MYRVFYELSVVCLCGFLFLSPPRQPGRGGEAKRERLAQAHPGSFVAERGFEPRSSSSRSDSQTTTANRLSAFALGVSSVGQPPYNEGYCVRPPHVRLAVLSVALTSSSFGVGGRGCPLHSASLSLKQLLFQSPPPKTTKKRQFWKELEFQRDKAPIQRLCLPWPPPADSSGVSTEGRSDTLPTLPPSLSSLLPLLPFPPFLNVLGKGDGQQAFPWRYRASLPGALGSTQVGTAAFQGRAPA